MSEKTMKKFVSLLLVFVMLVATVTIVPLNTQAADGSVVKRITVVKGKDINDIQYNKKNVLHSSAWWIDEDGTKYPAFCVDPNKAGPGEIAAGQYDLNISGAETNEKIAAILNNSIPYKTPAELGVANEEEAYAATKAAIWCVIGVSSYTNPDLWDAPGNQKVKDLFNKLVSLANSNPAPVQAAVYGTAKVDKEPVEEGEWWVQRFKVAETSNSGKAIKKYTVSLTGSYPDGTKVTDESGTEKSSFNGDENFVIRIPKSAVPEEGNVEANVAITANMFSNVILIGKPTDGMDGKVQDMEIAMPIQKVNMSAKMEVGKPPIPYDPPDTPPTLIVKYDEETGERLPGAQFAIYEQSNTARPVAEGVTDANGEFGATLKPGTYVIKELNPPPGYMISDKTQPERVIVVKDSDEQITIKVDNIKLPKLTIRKIDSITKQPVAGAVFEIKLADGTSAGSKTVTTDANGEAVIENLKADRYVVTEISVPQPYILNSEPQFVTLEGGDKKVLLFENQKKPSIKVVKYDEKTGEKLAGAQFAIYEQDDTTRPVAEGMTDANGEFKSGDIAPGTYVVKEINPPPGYMVSDKTKPERVIVAKADDGEIVVKVDNIKLPTLVVQKTDGTTNKGIPNTTYKIEYENPNGGLEQIGTFKTDADGRIILPSVKAGWYVITETLPAQGYQRPTNPVTRLYLAPGDNAYTQNTATTPTAPAAPSGTPVVTSGSQYQKVGDIINYPLNSIVIKKSDANTGEMLEGATFEVIRTTTETSGTNGTVVCTVTTDNSGVIVITGLEAGAYAIKEIKAPQNYLIDETNLQTVNLKADGTSVVEVIFRNYPYGSIVINKIDGTTKAPLEGAEFEVTEANGALIGTFTTDANGSILIPNLKPGSYVVKETKAPDGYMLTNDTKTIEIGTAGATIPLTFSNYKKGGLLIRKYDASTKEMLAGAEFKVERSDGTIIGTSNGIFKTDESGTISIPGLENGTYIITETKAPDGYAVSDNPTQKIVVDKVQTYTVDFYNYRKLGVQIIKIDADTRQPLEGAQFQIWHTGASSSTSVAAGTPAGVLVGTYTTDINGVINVVLPAGTYEILETKAPAGYIRDKHKQDIVVRDGELTSVTFTNTKAPSGTIIVYKTDSKTGDPIEGVSFEILKESGEIVKSGETDKNGRISVSGLDGGNYIVRETKAAEGYEEDNKDHKVFLEKYGVREIYIENKPLSGLRLHKIDAITKKGIYGVEFAVYDKNGKIVGNYWTDNNGYIDFEDELPEGRYTIKEITPAEGYYPETTPRTVEFKAGKMTVVKWENTPQLGQIRIQKLSGEYNENNALPKGTPLQGAVFEVLNWKTRNVVDRIETDYYGIATTKPLPLGRYIIKETQAPKFYKINPSELDVTIEFATQIVDCKVENYPANTSVAIDKLGAYEVMCGQETAYTIKNVRNSSTVPLDNFYWRDLLPANGAVLDRIITGTYNLQGRYKVMVTTSAGNTMVIADNLDTAKNNVIFCHPQVLGLASGEYVTSFTLMFGTVQPGFSMVQDAKIYMTIKNNLPNGTVLPNKADVGGQYGGEWCTSNSTWVTKVYNPTTPKLPKTGW